MLGNFTTFTPNVHKLWIEGCKVIQTHLTENHDAAAKWNALWARLEELFKRKGVEMA